MTSPATTALFAQTDMTPVGDSVTDAQRDAILSDVAAQLVQHADDQVVGICPVCFRAIVLTDGNVMVRHGWQEVGRRVGEYGYGRQYGQCGGVNYVPFQLSRVRTMAYLVELDAEIVAQRNVVAVWEAGPSPIRIPSYRSGKEDTIIHKGEPRYESALANKLSAAKSALDSMIRHAGEVKAAIEAWAPRQLTTREAIEKATREEIAQRNAGKKAERDAKNAVKTARAAKVKAKLDAKLAPVLAAMQAEPERWFSEDEIAALAKTSSEGKLTDTQLSEFTSGYRNKAIEAEYRDDPRGRFYNRILWVRLKR